MNSNLTHPDRDLFPALGDNFVRVAGSTAGEVRLWQSFLRALSHPQADLTDVALAKLVRLTPETFWRHRTLKASPTVNALPACLEHAGRENQARFLSLLIGASRSPFRLVPVESSDSVDSRVK